MPFTFECLKLYCLGQKLQDQTSSSIGDPPVSVYLGRHWCHSDDKTIQNKIPLRFCILQVTKNWLVGMPGSKAKSTDITEDNILWACTALNPKINQEIESSANIPEWSHALRTFWIRCNASTTWSPADLDSHPNLDKTCIGKAIAFKSAWFARPFGYSEGQINEAALATAYTFVLFILSTTVWLLRSTVTQVVG